MIDYMGLVQRLILLSSSCSNFLEVVLKRWIVIVMLLLTSIVDAKKTMEKNTISVCAVFKNEGNYLKEWIEYHRLIGVDHFYLYNNMSGDHFAQVLAPYVKERVVTLINWPDRVGGCGGERPFIWVLSTQIPAYENALKMATTCRTKWLIFLDVSEFIVPVADSSFKEMLSRYEGLSGISIATDYFDASDITALPRRKLLIETVEMTGTPKKNPDRGITKMVFQPQTCKGFSWPPYRCVFKEGQKEIEVGRGELRINHYTKRFKGFLDLGKKKDKLHLDNRDLTETQLYDLLEEGYEIEDQEQTISKFMPKLKEKMGF